MISAWVVKKPRKVRYCESCEEKIEIGEPHLRLYGGEDCYPQPWVLRAHIRCVKHSLEPKIQKALKEYCREKMASDPDWPRLADLADLLDDRKSLV